MVPSVIVPLEGLPLTPNGKVDRRALPAPEVKNLPRAGHVAPRAGLESSLAEIWCEALGVDRVGVEDNFFDLGGHSLLLVRVQNRIREQIGEEVEMLDLFRLPTISALAGFLAGRWAGEVTLKAPQQPSRALPDGGSKDSAAARQIAIIGMSGHFPGAKDLEELWRNLRDGVESVTFFTPEELEGVSRELLQDPGFVAAGGVLEGADQFDAPFFNISPREAQRLDPQQRLFLETSAEALERAGYGAGSPAARSARIGVFGGAGNSVSLQDIGKAATDSTPLEIVLGNDKDFIASRVSYKLDLRGPAVSVQTACSTSLVAVHLACKSLLDGDCDIALAGGARAHATRVRFYTHSPGSFLSADGHTRSFDARASGTVSSDGVGVVVLKTLARALADGDLVRAVIRGSAVNNDGADRIGFTAPSQEGQATVIAAAQASAGVPPASVQYIEVHGSATPIGDPIELSGLVRAFREGGAGDRRQTCALGSIKSNMGHTGAAAGVAGLIKTVLSLEHRQIPPSLYFESPNPAIDLAATPFFVNNSLAAWPANEGVPRRAGVSSFGIGGTNAHLVLEEAPRRELSGPSRDWQVLSLSARTETALETATDRLSEHLRCMPAGESPESEAAGLADIAFTLHVGRKVHEHRRMVVCRGRDDAAEALASRDPRRVLGGMVRSGAAADRPVAFVLSGLGEQYPGLAAGLYRGESGFRELFDRCAALFAPELGLDLAELMFDGAWREHRDRETDAGPDLRRLLGRGERSEAAGPLDRTAVLQPALFALEWSLARLLMEWGVEPRALLGYSLGKYVAACLAGVFSLEDAVRLVAARARLIDALPEGAMLALPLPEAEVVPWLGHRGLSLAAVNGPALSVVAGDPEAVAELEAWLSSREIPSRRLRTTHAFHSHRMEPASAPLTELVRGLALSPPRIPYLSNVTGTWITPEQATDPGYWAEHLQRPVRFAEGVAELWREPGRVLLEIGPGQSLAALALQHPGTAGSTAALALGTLPAVYERRPDQAVLLDTLGKLWLAGAAVNWPRLYDRERRRRVELPAHPMERRRYKPDWDRQERSTAPALARRSLLRRPAWQRTTPLRAPLAEEVRSSRWLILVDGPAGAGLGGRIAERLRKEEARVELAAVGGRFGPEDFDALLDGLEELPLRVLHLASLGWAPGSQLDRDFDRVQDLGFYSLLSLIRALARRAEERGASLASLRLAVVASGREQMTASDPLRPELAPLGAVCRVLPRELPGVICREIDVMPPVAGSPSEDRLAGALISELLRAAGSEGETPIAYRGRERWSRIFEPMPESAGAPPRLSRGGTVLLLGSPQDLLLAAAERLVRDTGARLALVGPIDPVHLEETRRRLRAFDPGALVFRSDLASEAGLGEVLREVEARRGPLLGVVVGDLAADLPLLTLAQAGREACALPLIHAVERLRTIGRLLAGKSLDLCLVTGTDAGLAGGPGLVLRAAFELTAAAYVAEWAEESSAPWSWLSWTLPVAGEEAGSALAAVFAGEPVPQLATSSPDALASPAEPQGETGSGMPFHPLLKNYVEPSTDLERGVVEIWKSLLGFDRLGVEDNLFELGGDSLMAMQVLNRVRKSWGVEVPPALLFETPTPAALASNIEALISAGTTKTDEPSAGRSTLIVPLSHRRSEFPLSPMQERLWIIHQIDPDSAAYNLAGALRLTGSLRPEALERTLAEVVRRHAALRTTFRTVEERPVQVIHSPADGFTLACVDLGDLGAGHQEAELRRLREEQTWTPFDLGQGPLLRMILLRLGAEDWGLLLTVHHIVADGWSMQVLSRELATLYGAFSRGEEPSLPELPIQYADYAVWQRERLSGEVLAEQIAYWRERLTGLPPLLELPLDRPRPLRQALPGRPGAQSFQPVSRSRCATWRTGKGRRSSWSCWRPGRPCWAG